MLNRLFFRKLFFFLFKNHKILKRLAAFHRIITDFVRRNFFQKNITSFFLFFIKPLLKRNTAVRFCSCLVCVALRHKPPHSSALFAHFQIVGAFVALVESIFTKGPLYLNTIELRNIVRKSCVVTLKLEKIFFNKINPNYTTQTNFTSCRLSATRENASVFCHRQLIFSNSGS